MIKKLINKFSVFEIVIISLMATLGIATKPVIVPLVNIITGPLYIPGGAIAGGLYMMWIVLGMGLIQKRGTATLIATVQAIMVISLGIYGSHGIMSFLTYIIPGLAVDTYLFIFKPKSFNMVSFFLGGILANLSGTFIVNIIFFRLPTIPLVLTLASASLSGGLGGLMAYGIFRKLEENGVMNNTIIGGGYNE